MTPKIKNIIIFVAVIIAFILIYIFFIKSSPEENNLISISSNSAIPSTTNTSKGSDVLATRDFLAILLSVKSIKLDDGIFSDAAFNALFDSNIVLIPDGTEGRTNPFAPIGSDFTSTLPKSTPTKASPPLIQTNTPTN